ncbi:MAG: hypothetical protein ACXAD7_00650 [Candidatus Kariarchaeaceae archaeon]|jgi:hypothetical protein
MSIPLPTAGGTQEEFKSKCELFDGDASTSGLCKGWITSTSKCMRREDELGNTCDGFGRFP